MIRDDILFWPIVFISTIRMSVSKGQKTERHILGGIRGGATGPKDRVEVERIPASPFLAYDNHGIVRLDCRMSQRHNFVPVRVM